MAERFDSEDQDWPLRPWLMAGAAALAGLAIHLLTDLTHDGAPIPVWRQAATSFVVVVTISFLMTVELRRWIWAVAFAIGWGAIIALVGSYTARYNHIGSIFEFHFWSGILAVLIASPLFQTIRDEGAWRFPYARVHRHAWTDGVIGAASIIFTGLTFLMAWLIASLFDVIGIEAIKNLLQQSWFGWMLAGAAFGGAVGLLRERDSLVAGLLRLATIVLAVLAPVMGVALAAFLISILFTGLDGLWQSSLPVTPMLMLASAGAFVLANDVIGDGDGDGSANVWLRRSALLLVLCVLPLALLAAASMGQRIGQYGWTPERIWGVIAVSVAIVYGLMGWWSAARGRSRFDDWLRPLQIRLAIGVCGLALLLALPIVDFGAISASSQLARLESGKIKADEFDWTAMAFDFGSSGRARLEELAKRGTVEQRPLAIAALAAENRYETADMVDSSAAEAGLATKLRVLPEGRRVSVELRKAIADSRFCRASPCSLIWIDDARVVIAGQRDGSDRIESQIYERDAKGVWSIFTRYVVEDPFLADMRSAPAEIRTVTRRQLFVDGKPVGEPFQ